MTPDAPRRQPWYITFHDLMPHRVREILLVSSPYDAFALEEDGRLTERIFTEHSELNLSSSPRIVHVSTAAKAYEVLEERRIDLVLTMIRLPDADVCAFGRRVKELHPKTPVVLLVLSEADLRELPGGVDSRAIDRVFVWTGDPSILLAIIKLVEDSRNVEHDTRKAGVRVIIVVEDSVRLYSAFLPVLYAELMAQSESLVHEGVNDLHRLMRMRARPKIQLATTYEEASEICHRFPDHVVALVSDLRFPMGGAEDARAGEKLVREVRDTRPDLPILLATAEAGGAEIARELGVAYVDKNSPHFIRGLRNFVLENLGFGDFIFRLPDRTEVGRARGMYELEEVLRTVPAESLAFHAARNHFSLWLMARSMFHLAARLRRIKVNEFHGIEGVRSHLLETLHEARLEEQMGAITDFSLRHSTESHFIRLGKGSIGGKARGVAFVGATLERNGLVDRFPELAIATPRSLVIGTQFFDQFVDENRLTELVQSHVDERVILLRCLSGRMPRELAHELRRAVTALRGPIAVRSSSLLEDSQLQPFAGIYATHMLANNHPDPEVRFGQLCQAVQAVWASVYTDDARAYIANTPFTVEEEKMAVLIQEMAGQPHGTRFYPSFSGVALSYNYYPVGHARAEDGTVLMALGLGHTIVGGGLALQFCPSHPGALPQFGSPAELLRFSQSTFYALDTSQSVVRIGEEGDRAVRLYHLEDAEEDGTLALVASTYSPEDDIVRDGLAATGVRVVTFANILKWQALPVAPVLAELLAVFQRAMGCPVEMEFAVDAPDHGRVLRRGEERRPATLYVLQVRPQATQLTDTVVEADGFPEASILFRSDRSLGHGVLEGIRDVVYVRRRDLECADTPGVADEVGVHNARLTAERRPYLLIGPGRWGSSDPRLGIPVKWGQIAGAKVIIETQFNDREVEPSQGAHFFHNVTSFRIGYLTLPSAGHTGPAGRRFFDHAWLEAQPAAAETATVRHLRFDQPLRIFLDGKNSRATVLKPEL